MKSAVKSLVGGSMKVSSGQSTVTSRKISDTSISHRSASRSEYTQIDPNTNPLQRSPIVPRKSVSRGRSFESVSANGVVENAHPYMKPLLRPMPIAIHLQDACRRMLVSTVAEPKAGGTLRARSMNNQQRSSSSVNTKRVIPVNQEEQQHPTTRGTVVSAGPRGSAATLGNQAGTTHVTPRVSLAGKHSGLRRAADPCMLRSCIVDESAPSTQRRSFITEQDIRPSCSPRVQALYEHGYQAMRERARTPDSFLKAERLWLQEERERYECCTFRPFIKPMVDYLPRDCTEHDQSRANSPPSVASIQHRNPVNVVLSRTSTHDRLYAQHAVNLKRREEQTEIMQQQALRQQREAMVPGKIKRGRSSVSRSREGDDSSANKLDVFQRLYSQRSRSASAQPLVDRSPRPKVVTLSNSIRRESDQKKSPIQSNGLRVISRDSNHSIVANRRPGTTSSRVREPTIFAVEDIPSNPVHTDNTATDLGLLSTRLTFEIDEAPPGRVLTALKQFVLTDEEDDTCRVTEFEEHPQSDSPTPFIIQDDDGNVSQEIEVHANKPVNHAGSGTIPSNETLFEPNACTSPPESQALIHLGMPSSNTGPLDPSLLPLVTESMESVYTFEVHSQVGSPSGFGDSTQGIPATSAINVSNEEITNSYVLHQKAAESSTNDKGSHMRTPHSLDIDASEIDDAATVFVEQ